MGVRGFGALDDWSHVAKVGFGIWIVFTSRMVVTMMLPARKKR